jgi:peptide deformylase
MSDEITNPPTLGVNVSDGLGAGDVFGPPADKTQTPEYVAAKAEFNRLQARWVVPPKKLSRWVTQADVARVVKEGQELLMLCRVGRPPYKSGFAVAHSQIEENEPLRFFVMANGLIVCNALIINHTKIPVLKKEGCLSVVDKPERTMVPRFNKIVAKYQPLVSGGGELPVLGPVVTENMSSLPAECFCHELDHMNGHTIYDEDWTQESCYMFGDGKVLTQEEVNKLYI